MTDEEITKAVGDLNQKANWLVDQFAYNPADESIPLLRYRGDWIRARTYNLGDVVTGPSGIYVAKRENSGELANNPDWMLIMRRGGTGSGGGATNSLLPTPSVPTIGDVVTVNQTGDGYILTPVGSLNRNYQPHPATAVSGECYYIDGGNTMALPAGAAVGDRIMVYCDTENWNDAWITPATGDTINQLPVGRSIQGHNQVWEFVKTTATNWTANLKTNDHHAHVINSDLVITDQNQEQYNRSILIVSDAQATRNIEVRYGVDKGFWVRVYSFSTNPVVVKGDGILEVCLPATAPATNAQLTLNQHESAMAEISMFANSQDFLLLSVWSEQPSALHAHYEQTPVQALANHWYMIENNEETSLPLTPDEGDIVRFLIWNAQGQNATVKRAAGVLIDGFDEDWVSWGYRQIFEFVADAAGNWHVHHLSGLEYTEDYTQATLTLNANAAPHYHEKKIYYKPTGNGFVSVADDLPIGFYCYIYNDSANAIVVAGDGNTVMHIPSGSSTADSVWVVAPNTELRIEIPSVDTHAGHAYLTYSGSTDAGYLPQIGNNLLHREYWLKPNTTMTLPDNPYQGQTFEFFVEASTGPATQCVITRPGGTVINGVDSDVVLLGIHKKYQFTADTNGNWIFQGEDGLRRGFGLAGNVTISVGNNTHLLYDEAEVEIVQTTSQVEVTLSNDLPPAFYCRFICNSTNGLKLKGDGTIIVAISGGTPSTSSEHELLNGEVAEVFIHNSDLDNPSRVHILPFKAYQPILLSRPGIDATKDNINASTSTTKWYRVASTSGSLGKLSGIFVVSTMEGSRSGQVIFSTSAETRSSATSSAPMINLISGSHFNDAIQGIRIVSTQTTSDTNAHFHVEVLIASDAGATSGRVRYENIGAYSEVDLVQFTSAPVLPTSPAGVVAQIDSVHLKGSQLGDMCIKDGREVYFTNGDTWSGSQHLSQHSYASDDSMQYPHHVFTTHDDTTEAQNSWGIQLNDTTATMAEDITESQLRITADGHGTLRDRTGAYVAPTIDTHIVTKKYVDDNTGAAHQKITTVAHFDANDHWKYIGVGGRICGTFTLLNKATAENKVGIFRMEINAVYGARPNGIITQCGTTRNSTTNSGVIGIGYRRVNDSNHMYIKLKGGSKTNDIYYLEYQRANAEDNFTMGWIDPNQAEINSLSYHSFAGNESFMYYGGGTLVKSPSARSDLTRAGEQTVVAGNLYNPILWQDGDTYTSVIDLDVDYDDAGTVYRNTYRIEIRNWHNSAEVVSVIDIGSIEHNYTNPETNPFTATVSSGDVLLQVPTIGSGETLDVGYTIINER